MSIDRGNQNKPKNRASADSPDRCDWLPIDDYSALPIGIAATLKVDRKG